MRGNRRLRRDSIGDSSTSLMDILGNSLGGVLFLLILVMVIMVLLPKAMATLRDVRVLPHGVGLAGAVELPPATIGEPYQVLFASEGGEEYVTFELASGGFPEGLNPMIATHGELSEDVPGHQTCVGLAGSPVGPAGPYVFELEAVSADPLSEENLAKWRTEEYKRFRRSEPKRFQIEVVEPAVKRVDEVEDIEIVSAEQLPPVRLSEDGQAKFTIAVKGGVRPYTWDVRSAPDLNLRVREDGEVTAQTEQPAQVQLSVSVTSSQAGLLRQRRKRVTDSKTLALTILPCCEPLEILTPDQLPPAVTEEAYTVALAARGGTGNYAWSILPEEEGTPLPPWLQVEQKEKACLSASAPKGTHSDEPYAFRIQVQDGEPGAEPVEKVVRLKVDAPALVREDATDPAAQVVITTKEDLPPATAGMGYGVMFAAQGGRPPYHWETVEWRRRKPDSADWEETSPGLQLGDDGWLEGEPSFWGKCELAVRVRDTAPDGSDRTRTAEKTVRLDIRPSLGEVETEPLRIITPPSLPDAFEGVSYEVALSAVGGMPPYQWAIEGEGPRSFLFKNPADGLLAGEPDAELVGKHDFAVVLSDQRGPTRAQKLEVSLMVRAGVRPLELATKSLPDAGLRHPYEAYLIARGGEPPFRWDVVAGSLPDGLDLDPDTGQVSGAAARLTDEPVSFTAQVTQEADGTSVQGEVTVSVRALISPEPLTILTDAVLPPAVVNVRYEAQLAAAGGVPPYKWIAGQPWPGLTAGTVKVSSSGRLTNPVFPSPKTHVFQAVVTDATDDQAGKEFRLKVHKKDEVPLPSPPKLKITTPEELPAAVVENEYQLAAAAEGGWAPFNWSLDGDLPDGLRFENGRIVGTPRAAQDEPSELTLKVRDSQVPPDTARRPVLLMVVAGEERPDWWKYFGFTIVLVIYLVLKQGINDKYFFVRRRQMMDDGLTIEVTRAGAYLGGPASARMAYRGLVKVDRVRVWVLRAAAVVGALILAHYLGIF